VAADNDIWFASAELTLLHILRFMQVAWSPKEAIPCRLERWPNERGRGFALVAAGQTVWADYKLAFLQAGKAGLNILPGKYHSLQSSGSRLLARHYSTLFEVHPDSNTMTQIDLDEKNLLTKRHVTRKSCSSACPTITKTAAKSSSADDLIFPRMDAGNSSGAQCGDGLTFPLKRISFSLTVLACLRVPGNIRARSVSAIRPCPSSGSD